MKFCVIVPVYNSEKYIEKTVKNILDQTYKYFSLIIVDDCSSDNTGAILKMLSERDGRITVRTNETNLGPAETRNVGLNEAEGDYVLFFDADDEIDCYLLEKLSYELRINQPDLLIYGCIEEYEKNNKIIYKKEIAITDAFYSDINEIHNLVVELESNTLFGYPWNKAFKLEIIKKNSLRFKNIWMIEDFHFNLDFFKKVETLQTLSITPYHYYIRDTKSVTSIFRKDYFDLHEARIIELIKAFEEWGCLDETKKKAIAVRYSRYFISAIEQGINNKNIKNWISGIMKSETFVFLKDYMYSDRFLLERLLRMVRKKRIKPLIFTGRIIHIIKKYFSGIFSRLKQNR